LITIIITKDIKDIPSGDPGNITSTAPLYAGHLGLAAGNSGLPMAGTARHNRAQLSDLSSKG
jgi:hypothetical protein